MDAPVVDDAGADPTGLSASTSDRRRLIAVWVLSAVMLLGILATVVLLLLGQNATWAAGIGGSALTGLLMLLAWPNSA